MLLHVCGRFGPAGCVWGSRGSGTSRGLEVEIPRGQKHSAPGNILSLSTSEEKEEEEGEVCSFCLDTLSDATQKGKYLILPGDGNPACVEFGVEVVVYVVQNDSLH